MKKAVNLKTAEPLKKIKYPGNLIVITGPTASGKTAASISLAQHFHAPVLSADSRQFFLEMNIGTAKPTPAELKKAEHHFIGHLSIHDDYDAGKFEADALKLVEQLFQKHSIVLMAGGSGMYIDAVCKGFDPLPETDELLREELTAVYKEKGIEALQKLLSELDPKHYYAVDLNNPHRLIRALEICIGTGKPYSSFRKGEPKERDFNIIKIGLELERKELYARIDARVDKMMEDGLLEEVRSLQEFKHLNALQTVGYRELFAYLDGEISLEEAVEKIKQDTRNFAKRQLTWFRKDKDITMFAPSDIKGMVKFIEKKCAS